MKFKKTYLCLVYLLILISLKSQTTVSGVLTSNTTWTKAGNPFILSNNLLVSQGVTLTIEEGVSVRINGNFYIKVEGFIKALGTRQSKISFESLTPTNAKNSWGGIRIRPTGGSLLNDDQTYNSGSFFRNVIFKNATTAIYIYGTGIFLSNIDFSDNEHALEVRSTNNVVIDSSSFFNNNNGIYTEYEAFDADQSTSIINTYVLNSHFTSNKNGIFIFLNQRDIRNMSIEKNTFKSNETGFVFSGGGYGCRVHSVSVRNNFFLDNSSYGLSVGQIYGESSESPTTMPAFPLIVENNVFNNCNVLWNFGGGVSGVRSRFNNNIVSSPLKVALSISGGSSKNDVFDNNYLYSNVSALSVKPLWGNSYIPSNKSFRYNTLMGRSSDPTIRIIGGNMIFNNNNLRYYNPDTLLKIDGDRDVDARNNYWGRTDLSGIKSLIYDKDDDFELGSAIVTPFLSANEDSAPLFRPHDVVKSTFSNRLRITWSPNREKDLAGYKVYYGNYDGTSFSNVLNVGFDTSVLLPSGVLYSDIIAVTAYDRYANGADDKFMGHESWYSFAQVAPTFPLGLISKSIANRLQLEWVRSESADRYDVYKSIDSINFTLIGRTSNNVFSDSAFTPTSNSFYRVIAFDSIDMTYRTYGLSSGLSNVASAVSTYDTVGVHVQHASAICNKSVDISVKVSKFRKMLTMQGSVNWNASDLRFDSIVHYGPEIMSMNASHFGKAGIQGGELSFSWNDVRDQGVTLDDSTVLFILRFTVLGAANRSVPITLTSNPVSLEFIDSSLMKQYVRTSAGSVSIACEIIIKGRVLTPLDGGLRRTSILLSSGTTSYSTSTDSSGNYNFKILPGTYTLTPNRNFEQEKRNGISTLDIALIQTHILQRRMLDASFKVIAADIDFSSSITTGDILYLRRLILGTDTTLPNNRIWAFVDGGQTFANPLTPFPFSSTKTFTNQSTDVSHIFRGIKIGDVNYDRNPLLDQAPSGDTLRLFGEWTDTEDGYATLRVKSRAVAGLLGWQSTLRWDPKQLQLQHVSGLINNLGIGERWKGDGYLTLSWNDPRAEGLSFTEGVAWMELKFRKTGSLQRAGVGITEEKLGTEAFNGNYQSMGVKMEPGELRGNAWNGMLRVYPNPATQYLNIEWKMERAGTATVRLLDAQGRTLYQETKTYQAGIQHLRMDSKAMRLSSGQCIIQIEQNGEKMLEKIIITGDQPMP